MPHWTHSLFTVLFLGVCDISGDELFLRSGAREGLLGQRTTALGEDLTAFTNSF